MRIQRHKKAIIGTGLALLLVLSASLIAAQDFYPRKWSARKVNLSFNHYYDWEEMEQALRTLETAYPKFLKLNTAGKSWLGRELCYAIENPARERYEINTEKIGRLLAIPDSRTTVREFILGWKAEKS